MKAQKKVHPIAHFNKLKADAHKKADTSMKAFKKSLIKKNDGGNPFDGILPPPTIGTPGPGPTGSSTRKPLDASFRVGPLSGGVKSNLNAADGPMSAATYRAGYTGKKGFGVNAGYDAGEKKVNAGVSYEGTIGKKHKVPIKVDVSYNKPSKMGGTVKKGKSKKK
jgi:hypothetical protein